MDGYKIFFQGDDGVTKPETADAAKLRDCSDVYTNSDIKALLQVDG